MLGFFCGCCSVTLFTSLCEGTFYCNLGGPVHDIDGTIMMRPRFATALGHVSMAIFPLPYMTAFVSYTLFLY